MNIEEIKTELKTNSEKAGIRYEFHCTEAAPYWDGWEVRSSLELWHEFCERVLERVNKGEDLEEAFDAECARGGIEADYMIESPMGTHFIVSSETLGNEESPDEYIELVANILTTMGYPTRAIPNNELYKNQDNGCGAIPKEVLFEAMKKADKFTKKEHLETSPKEKIEQAIISLRGGNGSFYPVDALTNPEATTHDEVAEAVSFALGEDFDFPTIDDWYYVMDEEESSKYKDINEFIEDCQSKNSDIIALAIKTLEEKLS